MALKVNIRLPPTLDADKAEAVLREVLLDPKNNPYNAKIELDEVSKGNGFDAPELPPEIMSILKVSSKKYFGKEPLLVGGGGGIPFMNVFSELFPKAMFLLTGVGFPESNAHAANESIELEYTRKLTTLISDLMTELK